LNADKENLPYRRIRPSLASGETLEKKTEFEVVPLAEVLQKALPIEEVEPGEDGFAGSTSPNGRLIENAPFGMSKRGGK
jgi:hypothetical protein